MAFSKVLKLSCNRIQFTPDVMPADVTGFTVLLKDAHTMEYRPGAAMCNLLLADEINRASTRTQSALLEAMEENAVTVDGVTHALPQPFMVIATQNPSGSAGDVYKRQQLHLLFSVPGFANFSIEHILTHFTKVMVELY